MDITQLPWHFDIAFVGMIFMYIGFLVKKNEILNRMNIIHKIAFARSGGTHVTEFSRRYAVEKLW